MLFLHIFFACTLCYLKNCVLIAEGRALLPKEGQGGAGPRGGCDLRIYYALTPYNTRFYLLGSRNA